MENSTRKIDYHQALTEAVFQRFTGRRDVYAIHDRSNNTFYPVCANKLDSHLCRIGKQAQPCHECPGKQYDRFTTDVVRRHIKGKIRVGVYPLQKDNTCRFVAIDLDDHGRGAGVDPLADAKRLHGACKNEGIPCYVLKSKSGKGFHCYVFFSDPVPAWKARQVALAFVERSGLAQGQGTTSSFDRIFPNQDSLGPGKNLGNLIALPFHGGSIREGHTVFLDPKTDFTHPHTDQLAALKSVECVTEARLDELIRAWNLKPHSARAGSNVARGPFEGPQTGREQFLACDFIAWCRENQAQVSEPLWWDMLTNLVRLEPDGPELCHDYSRQHPGYNRAEAGTKIHRAKSEHQPHTCEEIRKNGFNCTKTCGVRAPAGLLCRSGDSQDADHEQRSQAALDALNKAVSRAKEKDFSAIPEIMRDAAMMENLGGLYAHGSNALDAFWFDFRQAGVAGKDLERFEKAVKREASKPTLRIVRPQETVEVPPIGDLLDNVPWEADLRVPPGWEISSEHGVIKVEWRETGKGGAQRVTKTVCSVPVLITKRFVNVQTGDEESELSWIRDGKWQKTVVDRKVSIHGVSPHILCIY